jgi:hypothetical protein
MLKIWEIRISTRGGEVYQAHPKLIDGLLREYIPR